MKKYYVLLSLLISIGISNLIHAQTPERINYQAQLRDVSGTPFSDIEVTVQVSILSQDANGTLEYQETHTTSTDDIGTFSLVIGDGDVISGQIGNIQWGATAHFLQVEVDLGNGEGFTLLETTQLISVPYSIQSRNVDGVSLIPNSFLIIDENGNTIAGTEALGDDSEFNTLVGQSSGSASMTGDQNTLIGYEAGQNLTTANENVFIGNSAGSNNTTGSFNTFIGTSAGISNTDGEFNTFVGTDAGANMLGPSNVALGTSSGFGNVDGFGNVFLGVNTGFNNNGFRNVFIGLAAGINETGSEKLIIANGDEPDDELITGDFTTGNVNVNGELETGVGIRFPDGSLQTTAANNQNGAVPVGAIIMWSGITAPEGWALCDGQNGTPDLRGRFIVGHDPDNDDYDFPGNISGGGDNQGETGGEEAVILTEAQLASHSHTNRVFNGFGDSQNAANTFPAGRTFAASAFRSLRREIWDNENSNEIQPSGDNEAHENRPPYYVLAFIIKIE